MLGSTEQVLPNNVVTGSVYNRAWHAHSATSWARLRLLSEIAAVRYGSRVSFGQLKFTAEKQPLKFSNPETDLGRKYQGN